MMPTSDVVPADPQAWVEQHGDYLYRFALAKVREQDAAEELVQDTLLAAWQGRNEFAGQASERSWLTAILKRKVVDWLRRRIRERARAAPGEEPDGFAAAQFNRLGKWKRTPINWGRGDPAENLNRDEFWAALRACLGKLPPRLHDVFVLRYLDEATGDEVCREMGLSESNLWVMLYRARLRVCRCLSVNWFGETPSDGALPC